MNHPIELQPLYDYVNQTLPLVGIIIVSFVGRYAVSWLQSHAKFLDERTDTSIRDALEAIINNGIKLGMAQVSKEELAHPEVDAPNMVVRIAGQYVVDHAPGYLDHFGLSPEAVGNMVAARLPNVATTTDTTGAKDPIVPVQTLPLKGL
jgi:hypothetical protein